MATLNDEIEKMDKEGKLNTAADGVIEKALDRCLRVAEKEKRTGGNEYVNVLFIGGGGSGKTSRIKAWAKAHNINLKEVHTADLDQTDMHRTVLEINGLRLAVLFAHATALAIVLVETDAKQGKTRDEAEEGAHGTNRVAIHATFAPCEESQY